MSSGDEKQIEILEQVTGLAGKHQPLIVSFALYAIASGKAYLYGVFASPWSWETMGVGKTVYALKALVRIYGSWEEAKRYIVFMPQDFLAVFDRARRSGEPAKMILWDDAGMWIGRMRWQDKYVKVIREFLNVIRTHCHNVVFTAPSVGELVRGVREQINVFVFVSSVSEKPPRSRAEIVFKPWVDRFLSKKERACIVETFRRYFEYYSDYLEIRRRFVEIGARRLETSLNEVIKEITEATSYIRDTYRGTEVEEVEEDEIDLLGEYLPRIGGGV